MQRHGKAEKSAAKARHRVAGAPIYPRRFLRRRRRAAGRRQGTERKNDMGEREEKGQNAGTLDANISAARLLTRMAREEAVTGNGRAVKECARNLLLRAVAGWVGDGVCTVPCGGRGAVAEFLLGKGDAVERAAMNPQALVWDEGLRQEVLGGEGDAGRKEESVRRRISILGLAVDLVWHAGATIVALERL